MRVRFWGVRGSVSWASATSIGFGCNTPCVEVVHEPSGSTLVLDAGSGIVGLGDAMAGRPRDVPILLTHYHWDHLQGLPFFGPLFTPGWSPTIWAPALSSGASVETVFDSPYFPVPYHRLPNRPPIDIVRPGEVAIGPFEVRVLPLNHPGGAFAYRIRGTGGDFVYATDHQFGDETIDRALGAFVRGARAVILDAHFVPEEMPTHRGWGHGDWAQCARFAAEHDVERLWLFHHKPGRTDDELTDIEAYAREIFPATDVAAEGRRFRV
jgi:phosphoribosyl 1,2-cyclic phosphodiesterase